MAWFTRDVTRTLMAEGPVLLFGLAGSILTARVLGPDDRGVYALCITVAQTAGFLGALQIGQAMTWAMGRSDVEPEQAAGAGLPLGLLLGAAVFGALLALEPWLLTVFDLLSPTTLRLSAALAAFLVFNTIALEFFRAADDLDRYNVCRMLNPTIRVTALAVAFAGGGRLEAALVAVTSGEALLLAVAGAMLARRWRPSLRGFGAVAGSLLRFGARLQAAAIVGLVDVRIATFIVAAWVAADQLAFFAVAEGLVLYVVMIPTLVGYVLLPKIARADDAVAADMTAAACRSTLFVTTGALVVLAAASHPLIELLYGADYGPSALILVILLPVALGRAGNRILGRYVIVSNRLYWMGIANTLSLAVHVGLLLLWVPGHGAAGAAAATSSSVMLRFAILVLAFRRLSGAGLAETLWVRGDDVARIWRAGMDIVSLRALRRPDAGGGAEGGA
jgi:O-antigen/teichoic acid export membrane protein